MRIDVTIDDVSRVRIAATNAGSFRLLLAVDAFRAESGASQSSHSLTHSLALTHSRTKPVELTSLVEAKGRVLSLRVPDRESVSGELTLISIPPAGLLSYLFGGHESQEACTGQFVVDDTKAKPTNKFTIVLVAPGVDAPQVQAELKVTIVCSRDVAAPATAAASASAAAGSTAAAAAAAVSAQPRLSLTSSDERYRCKEFVAADYAAAAELALKFCNTVLDKQGRVISFTERPFGTTGAACVKVFFEVFSPQE